QRFSDRAVLELKRVADRHERRRLGHPIALHDRESQPLPEGFCLFIQGRAARYESPEFPTEAAMDVAEYQPSPQIMFAPSLAESPQKILQLAACRVIALDLFAQGFELAWHGGRDRDSLAFDQGDDLGRVERM